MASPSTHETPSAQYSDASSSYWPPGWNYERFSNATSQEVYALPGDELAKLQAGLREALGEDGVAALSQHTFREAQSRARAQAALDPGTKAAVPVFSPPNWLREWRWRSNGQPWGFVCFRTACYDDEQRWRDFKKKFQVLVTSVFVQDADVGPGVVLPDDFEEAKAAFNIQWIEDPELAGAEADVLRARYKTLEASVPSGLAHPLFLCASPKTVEAVEREEVKPQTAVPKYWQNEAPYLLAVTTHAQSGLEEDHDEEVYFKPVFKVAVESLAGELWHILSSGMMDLHRITISIKASDEMGVVNWQGDNGNLEEIWWTMAPSPARLRRRRGV